MFIVSETISFNQDSLSTGKARLSDGSPLLFQSIIAASAHHYAFCDPFA
jgi:hypothetical protein